jgi:hypothetical protein
VTSDFTSDSDHRDALYESLAGAEPAVRDVDPLTLLRRLVDRVAASATTRTAALSTLDRLRAIANASSVNAAVALATASFPDAGAFREAIFFVRCIDRDAAIALRLLDDRLYIEAALVPDTLTELATDRRAVLDAATFTALWQEPARGAWMDGVIALWKRDFVALYTRSHEAYRAALAVGAERIDAEGARAAALERLNTLARLGPPLGVAALAQLRELERLSPCVSTPSELAATLAATPVCNVCSFILGTEAPVADVRRAVTALNRALTAQQSRLSRSVVTRILSRRPPGAGERLDDFLRVLQASDIAGLALVLDDGLVNFLRDLLEAPATENVLALLALRFPEVTAANLNAAVDDFRLLLQDALAREGRVRLSEGRRP